MNIGQRQLDAGSDHYIRLAENRNVEAAGWGMRPRDEGVVRLLYEFLGSGSGNSAWAIGGAPPRLCINVPSGDWRARFTTGALGAFDSNSPVDAAISDAIDRIDGHGDRVDRELLESAAFHATDPHGVFVAWFLVMAWGAGPAVSRSRTTQWLRARQEPGTLLRALDAGRANVAIGNLTAAYSACPARVGHGPSYWTKWLWLIGVAHPIVRPTPSILDAKIRQTLGKARASCDQRRLPAWRAEGGNSAARWADYCDSLDRWARDLMNLDHTWLADAGRLEQVLFERGPGSF